MPELPDLLKMIIAFAAWGFWSKLPGSRDNNIAALLGDILGCLMFMTASILFLIYC